MPRNDWKHKIIRYLNDLRKQGRIWYCDNRNKKTGLPDLVILTRIGKYYFDIITNYVDISEDKRKWQFYKFIKSALKNKSVRYLRFNNFEEFKTWLDKELYYDH